MKPLIHRIAHLSFLSLLLAAAWPAGASNWPGWRGPDGTGVSAEGQLPLNWSPTQHVRWRSELPGRGNSSPIVWGDAVFVTQAVSSENRRTVMCFDRGTGKLRWQSGVTYADKEPTQRDNPYCAATPVTDGQRVIASFGSAGVYCYDLKGQELWHQNLGKMNHMFGNASSPILHGDFCILNFGPDEKARLVALRKDTGAIAWEAQPPKVDASEREASGGPGGGGFGPGQMIAPQMLSQGDKDKDKTLSKEEFLGLGTAWFDQLDTDKAGKLDQESFTGRLGKVLPPPEGFGPGGGPGGDRPPGEAPPGGRRGGFGPARFAGPGLFAAADANKDGSLTREEWSGAFAKWFGEWDADHRGSLDEKKLRDGLNAALPRPQMGGPGGRGGQGPVGGSWSTPLIIQTDGREELIMNFPNRLVAYDPKTGRELWWSKGLGGTIYTTPLWGEGVLVAMSSGMGSGNAIAVRPGGSGEVTESRRIWKLDRIKSGIGSGVIHEGHLYAVSQDGIALCLDLKTGKTVWEERLKGSGSRNSSWSSLVLADGKIYVPNQSGDVFVLRAGPTFELLATNAVGEPTNASLAASAGDLFLRTDKGLWCLAGRP
jgi:outer membrane protein assembly factor BamB